MASNRASKEMLEQMEDEKFRLQQELDSVKLIATRRQTDRESEVSYKCLPPLFSSFGVGFLLTNSGLVSVAQKVRLGLIVEWRNLVKVGKHH